MSSAHKNLSEIQDVPSAAGMRFAIVCSEWNISITGALHQACKTFLLDKGASADSILEYWVPGSFELVCGAQTVADTQKVDAIICLGCVIQGETRHFDFICDAVAKGITNLSISYAKPFVFGILTPNTLEQATDRAGGKHGNKGDEAAATAIKMVHLQKQLRKGNKITGFGSPL